MRTLNYLSLPKINWQLINYSLLWAFPHTLKCCLCCRPLNFVDKSGGFLHYTLDEALFRFEKTRVRLRHPHASVQRAMSHCHLCSSNNGGGGQRRWDKGLGATRLVFFLLSGMVSIRQTRPTLLFRREAAGFCGAFPVPACLCVVQQSSVRVVGGRMVILSSQMDRKNPGGIWEATGTVVFTLCVHVRVSWCEILAWSILVLWWGCLRRHPPLMQQMSSLSVWVVLQIIRSVRR